MRNDKQIRITTTNQIIDVAGAADFFGVTERAIRSRIARQQIPFRRLGGSIVFSRAELERFLCELPGVSIEEARSRAKG
jgi:hypothetical protein